MVRCQVAAGMHIGFECFTVVQLCRIVMILYSAGVLTFEVDLFAVFCARTN